MQDSEDAWESIKAAMSDVTQTVSRSISNLNTSISSWLNEEEDEDQSPHISGCDEPLRHNDYRFKDS